MYDLTALDSWLNVDTWHTYHQRDEARFHRAVRQLFVENGTRVEPERFRDYILNAKHGKFNAEDLQRRAEEYSERYDAIRSFVMDAEVEFK